MIGRAVSQSIDRIPDVLPTIPRPKFLPDAR
jgi:hypothetical protein